MSADASLDLGASPARASTRIQQSGYPPHPYRSAWRFLLVRARVLFFRFARHSRRLEAEEAWLIYSQEGRFFSLGPGSRRRHHVRVMRRGRRSPSAPVAYTRGVFGPGQTLSNPGRVEKGVRISYNAPPPSPPLKVVLSARSAPLHINSAPHEFFPMSQNPVKTVFFLQGCALPETPFSCLLGLSLGVGRENNDGRKYAYSRTEIKSPTTGARNCCLEC
jgi:hypothetical protein